MMTWKAFDERMQALGPLISEFIVTHNVSLTITGNSMCPFLRHGREVVYLKRLACESIFKNDIVLIRRDTGAYVLHRIILKTQSAFYMAGDAQVALEGPLRPDQIVGVLFAVERGRFKYNRWMSRHFWVLLSARPRAHVKGLAKKLLKNFLE